MTHASTEIGKRLKTIFLDWKKGRSHGERGIPSFAEEIGKSHTALKNYFTGVYHSIPSDVLDRLSEMGYNSEWLLHGTGKKRADQKETMNFTETVKLRTELANLRQELKLTNARLAEVDKELQELKKLVKLPGVNRV